MLEILFWDPACNKDWLSLIEVKQHKTWQGMVLTYLMVKIELQNDNILNKDILNWMHLTWQLTGLCQCSTRLSARLDLNYYCLKQIYEMFLTLLFLLGRKQKCFWPINDWDLGSHRLVSCNEVTGISCKTNSYWYMQNRKAIKRDRSFKKIVSQS